MVEAEQYVLPDSRFGMTRTRYNVPAIPDVLPDQETLRKANRLNEHRFKALTAQQRTFVDAYLENGFDVQEAALTALLTRDRDEALRLGKRLIRKPYIATCVQLAMDYASQRSQLRLEDVINEIKNIAFSNMGDYFKSSGGDDGEPILRLPEDHERGKLSAIQEITCETYMEGKGKDSREVKRTKFKLYSKLDALEKLLKIMQAQGVKGAGKDPAAAEPAAQHVHVHTINIVAVPRGQFIPAPVLELKQIEQIPVQRALVG